MYRILFVGALIVGIVIFSSLHISAQTVDTSTVVEDGSVPSPSSSPIFLTEPSPALSELEQAVRSITSTDVLSLSSAQILGLSSNEKLDSILKKLDSLLERRCVP